jgi:hypothetical protein
MLQFLSRSKVEMDLPPLTLKIQKKNTPKSNVNLYTLQEQEAAETKKTRENREKAANAAAWSRWEEEEENVWNVPLNLIRANDPYANLNVFNKPETPKAQKIVLKEPSAPSRKRKLNRPNRTNYKRGKGRRTRRSRRQ